ASLLAHEPIAAAPVDELPFAARRSCLPSPAPWLGSAVSAHAVRQASASTPRTVGAWHSACAMGGRAQPLRWAREVLLRSRSWSKSHAALLASRASDMRAAPSLPEALLWAALVNRKLDGVAFRRQVPLAGY